jgi:Glycosyltransferase family 87
MPLASIPAPTLPSELRLALAILLDGAVIAAAWRFVRRRIDSPAIDRATDALLLIFLIQYVAVAVPGVLGILSPRSIAATALIIAAVLFRASARPTAAPKPPPLASLDRNVLLAAVLFGSGYLLALLRNQYILPVMSNDALTYHFPAAVHWLGTGRLSLYETWYFNPANTYSPLAGSTLVAWYIAPFGNDVLARFVQFPAVALIFLATLRLARALGAPTALAATIALALILSQPVVRQAMIEKDDLYVAAFFAAALAACAPERLRDRLGPWRVGAAIGLLAATKYTALMALPVLLLAADAPARAGWRWRHYAAALGIAVAIAGPWYLRNAILTGNPLYPADVRVFGRTIFAGLFTTAPATELRSPRTLLDVLLNRDQSLPLAPSLLALIGCLAAFTARFRRLRDDPLSRACLLGPPPALAIFLIASPYPEVRFILPAYVLVLAACAIGINDWIRRPVVQLLPAAILLLTCFWTGLWIAGVVEFGPTALIVTLAGFALIAIAQKIPPRLKPKVLGYGAAGATIAVALLVYVRWNAYLSLLRLHAIPGYAPYYEESAVWKFVRDELPENQTLAYANTFLVHPMYGFEHKRPLVYVPTRPGVSHFHDLPRLADRPIPGERLIRATAAALAADPDPDDWLRRLFASNATHIVVFHHQVPGNPPELQIIRDHADRFEQLYADQVGSVYRLRR